MNNNRKKINNKLPELLEAVCDHKDCPDWLADAIWDAMSDKTTSVMFTKKHFQAALENVQTTEKRELRRTNILDSEVVQ